MCVEIKKESGRVADCFALAERKIVIVHIEQQNAL
jgi:hypothetical protein